jgi:23S rRNA (cytidine1920-2'-O)/16S rRNA (cytidine1409-2'-O)-methyltransferase
MSADTAQRRRRADVELVRRGLVASREEAQDAIAANLVLVDGAPVSKAATQVTAARLLVLRSPPHPYVSRGGIKLDHALERFGIDVSGMRCLDAGISTGGFTDRLLQGGAAAVIGIDVGYGQVHERVRSDPRVEVRERTNVRDVGLDTLPWRPDLIVADLSFISLSTVTAGLLALLAPDGRALLLVKPQFEAGRDHVGRGGVVRDPVGWAAALRSATDAVRAAGHEVAALTASPITGPAGNVEFLLLTRVPAVAGPGGHESPADVDALVVRAIEEGTVVSAGVSGPGDATDQPTAVAQEPASGKGRS